MAEVAEFILLGLRILSAVCFVIGLLAYMYNKSKAGWRVNFWNHPVDEDPVYSNRAEKWQTFAVGALMVYVLIAVVQVWLDI